MKQNYKSNTWKIAASMIATDSTFSIGVFAIFMIFIGLSLSEISIIISAYLIFSSIGQIPSGIFADRYGYKTSLVIGSIFFLIGTIFFAIAQNFTHFAIGYSLMGFGSAMKQGADHALLFEGLKADGEESKFKKIAGKIDLFTSIFWVVTSVLGGLLYTINERLPFYAEVVVVAICLVIIIFAKEPERVFEKSTVISQIKNSLKQAFKTPKFSKIFIFSAIIGSIALTTFQYLQPLYKSIGISEIYFGILASGAFIIRGLGASLAEKVGKVFEIDKYIVLHASIFGLFLIFMQKTESIFFILPIIGVFYFLRGLYAPTISTYINEKVSSSNRATMLSINSQVLTLVSSISLIFGGIIADKYGLPTTFFAISVASLVFLILYVLFLRTVKAD
jgi:MFS family permease